MSSAHDVDRARNWLDLAIKAAAVIAIVAYLARRDSDIAQATTGLAELRSVTTDLAKGVAVSTARIDALTDRIRNLED